MTNTGHPHAITIEPHPKRVRVSFGEFCIADSRQALLLREGPLPPVLYFPREDVQMDYLQRTEHSTHCPFKGDASYFSISAGSKVVENAVWTYESPISSVGEIKGYLAFDREQVDDYEESE